MKTFQQHLAESKWEHLSWEEGTRTKGELRPGLRAEDHHGVYAHIKHSDGHHYSVGNHDSGEGYALHKDGKIIAGHDGGEHGLNHKQLNDHLKKHGLPSINKRKLED